MLDDYLDVIAIHTVHIAMDAEGVAGAVVVIDDGNGVLLDNVAVHPRTQGRGLGRRLIALAEQIAIDRSYGFIDLYTHEAMTENYAMYQHLGYVETSRRLEKGYHRIYMRKPLGESAG